MTYEIPRYIVWSTDRVDNNDPFQHRWLLRQILQHGRAEDIQHIDLDELEHELDELDLTSDLFRLWKDYLESRHDRG